MPVLIPVKASVKVVRKGKRVAVPVGKPFQFTDEEVKTIHAIMPSALRSPVVEKFVADEEEDEDEDVDLDLEAEDEDEAEDASGEAEKPAAASSAKKAPAKKSAAKKAAAADDDI